MLWGHSKKGALLTWSYSYCTVTVSVCLPLVGFTSSFYYCFVFGSHHLYSGLTIISEFRDHSRWVSEIIWGDGHWIKVNLMQGNHPIFCTISGPNLWCFWISCAEHPFNAYWTTNLSQLFTVESSPASIYFVKSSFLLIMLSFKILIIFSSFAGLQSWWNGKLQKAWALWIMKLQTCIKAQALLALCLNNLRCLIILLQNCLENNPCDRFHQQIPSSLYLSVCIWEVL